ncbi:MAG: isochorismatase family cysteine hydrolase, partial [Oscillospiraceae bacterium]
MNIPQKSDFLSLSGTALDGIYDEIFSCKEVKLCDFSPNKTMLVVVDVINGFIKEGALGSPSIGVIIPNVKKLMQACEKAAVPVVAFADFHAETSPEFGSFPKHCLMNTSECEIVDEIKNCCKYILIKKNSTNGLWEQNFLALLGANPEINEFIVVGDCTDICVLQFCLSLKAFFNLSDKKCRITIPINAVDTYDFGTH